MGVLKDKKINTFKNLLFGFRLVWDVDKSRVITIMSNRIVMRVFEVYIYAYLVKLVVNSIQLKKSFNEIGIILVITLIVTLILRVWTLWVNHQFSLKSNIKINEKFDLMIYKKSTEVELACYESPEYYNKFSRASKEGFNKATAIPFLLANNIGRFLSLIALFGVIASMDLPLAILALIPPIFSIPIRKKINKLGYQQNIESTPSNRKADYTRRAVFFNTFAKEMRMSNIFSVLEKRFIEGIKTGSEISIKYGKKYMLLNALLSFLTMFFMDICVYLYLAYRILVSQSMLIGDLVSIVSAVYMISERLGYMSDDIAQFDNAALQMENAREFMEHESTIKYKKDGAPVPKRGNNIEIKNLSFRYQGTTKDVLKNINISIKSGEKVAFVGHNGAGKSTLIKLIMRLYDPTEGCIYLNDSDLKDVNIESYREAVGAVFQDYQVFAVSIIENILAREIRNKDDLNRVDNALKLAELKEKVDSLPNGVNTVLSREFNEDGTNLSGGENQKITIARVFAKDPDIVILDEPSSALDPIAEYNVYNNMMKCCKSENGEKDKTVIFISHRLSSTKMADRIYHIEYGEIIEVGSHEELMAKNGKYADMFRKQAEKYLEEGVAV